MPRTRGRVAASLKHTIASNKSFQAPHPPPFGSPPPLSSRVFNTNSQIIIFGKKRCFLIPADYNNQVSSLRARYPRFSTVLSYTREKSIQRRFSLDTDFRDLFRSIQDDSKCGFSLAAFIRQATIDRRTWLGNVSVRGRLCVPPSHWNRDIFSQPVVEAEVPADVALELDSVSNSSSLSLLLTFNIL